MPTPDYSISTPENVDLHLELAGMGNRVLACLIDTFLTFAAIALIFLAAWGAFTGIGMSPIPSHVKGIAYGFVLMVSLFVAFIVNFGYHMFFEGTWQGQTPGKRVAHIRVIEQNGQPVGWPAVIIRNLVRVFDQGVILVGLLSMIVDKNERRFGDLAAGTLVIRERASELTSKVAQLTTTPPSAHPLVLDVGRITPEEYEILVSFLKRRTQMSRSHRPLVAKRLTEHFENRLGEQSQFTNGEAFLEQIYNDYQSRAES